jgi:hypothetical protein
LLLVKRGATPRGSSAAGWQDDVKMALVRSTASPDLADRDGLSTRQLASRKRDERFCIALAGALGR